MSKEIIKVRDVSDQSYLNFASFSDGKPFVRERNKKRIRDGLFVSSYACLEVCKALKWHRENVTHGEWQNDLKELGILDRTARRYLAIANGLDQFEQAVAEDLYKQLGPTKLLELLSGPEAELAKLHESGKYLDSTPEELAELTIKQLSQKIREATTAQLEINKDLTAENLALKQNIKETRKQNKELETEISRARLGIPKPDEMPTWFGHFDKAIEALTEFQTALYKDPPDLGDQDTQIRCNNMQQMLEVQYKKCVDFLVNWSLMPPSEFSIGRQLTIARMKRDLRFDWSENIELDEADDEGNGQVDG